MYLIAPLYTTVYTMKYACTNDLKNNYWYDIVAIVLFIDLKLITTMCTNFRLITIMCISIFYLQLAIFN